MNHFKTLADMHRFYGIQAPENPLLSVMRYDETTRFGNEEFITDFYMIGLKKLKSGIMLYGRKKCDHDTGSMLFIKPRQVVEFKNLELEEDSFMIFVHENYLHGHSLHSEIGKYGFFDYETNEALHLSPAEERIMWDLYFKIDAECHNNVDEYSRGIILTHVDSILKYSQRFYKRQFIYRRESGSKTAAKFNDALVNYMNGGLINSQGLPTVSKIASGLNLSTRYLSDLLKQETGKTAIELIHIYLIGEAKNRLKASEHTIAEIAYALGFENPPYFSRLFKKQTGVSPNQFKKSFLN
jgi:AraC family transcriptional activator of pobA